MSLVRYYSQHGEDYLLYKFFDCKTEGFYIDVGAFDGLHLSNTLTFEQLGWKGICVEPHPKFFPLCQSQRPNAVSIQVACTDKTYEHLTFFSEGLGLLSSLENSSEMETDIEERYDSRGLEYSGVEQVDVSGQRLSDLIESLDETPDEIDFISIDVEGHELSVLRGIDFELHQPRIYVIEANDDESEKELCEFFQANSNYQLARKVGVNCFFAKTKADIKALNEIDIHCVIEKQLHPNGMEFTLEPFADGKVIDEAEARRVEKLEERIEKLRAKTFSRKEEVELLKQRVTFLEESVRFLSSQLKDFYAVVIPLYKLRQGLVNNGNPKGRLVAMRKALSAFKKLRKNLRKFINSYYFLPTPQQSRIKLHNFSVVVKRGVRPVLIFQVGKVGSSSLVSSVREKINPAIPVYQVHNIVGAEDLQKQEVAKGWYQSYKHLNLGKALRRSIISYPGLGFKVVTGVREPIARWVSDIFQNLDERYSFLRDEKGQLRREEALVFIKGSVHDEPMQNWFDNELNAALGVDIFAHAFDKEKGYSVIESGKHEVLLYTLESIKDDFQDVLGVYLDIGGLDIQQENRASSKGISEEYEWVINNLKFSREELTKIYSKPVYQHFYSDEQIKGFIERWLTDRSLP